MEPARKQFDVHCQLNILLADDSPSNQRLLVHKFTRIGHKVTIADNGLEALEKWRSGTYDLILMDLMMPVMDGYEAVRRIRAEEEAGGHRRTPIIAVTANEDVSIYEKCLESGMDNYVAKPLTPPRLDDLFALLGAASAALSSENLLLPGHDGLFDSNFLGAVVNNPDRVVHYAELLLADLDREMGLLADAVKAGDRDAVFKSAHTIKGAACPLKGLEMSALAGQMQLAAQTEDEGYLITLLGQLQEVYKKVRLELERVSLPK